MIFLKFKIIFCDNLEIKNKIAYLLLVLFDCKGSIFAFMWKLYVKFSILSVNARFIGP